MKVDPTKIIQYEQPALPYTGTAASSYPLGGFVAIGDGSTKSFLVSQPVTQNSQFYVQDWQGNQLQYSTPRTNTAEYSITPGTSGNWINANLILATATALVPGGVSAKVTGNGTFSSFSPNLLTNMVGLNTFSIIIENVSEIASLIGIYDDTSAATVAYYTYTWSTQTITRQGGYDSNSKCVVQNLGTGPNGGATIKLSVSGTGTAGNNISAHFYPDNESYTTNSLIVHTGQVEPGGTATSIIPTTTSPVTVTDYSLTQNNLAFSAAPLNNSIVTVGPADCRFVRSIRLISTSDCNVSWGLGLTATANSLLLRKNKAEYFGATRGDVLSVIQNSAPGTLYISEMSD